MAPQAFYESELQRLNDHLKLLKKRKSIFGIVRFGNIAAIIFIFWFLWNMAPVITAIAAVILLFVFVRLIHRDLANREAIEHTGRLIKINEDELLMLSGKFDHFGNGNEFIANDHFYANDMDILGPSSLFQYVNRTSSEPGAYTLAGWLLSPADHNEILLRQSAIKELAALPLWRQLFLSAGRKEPIRRITVERVGSWLQTAPLFSSFKPWKYLRFIMPAIIIAILIAALTNVISMSILYGSLLLYALIAFQINRVTAPVHEQLSKITSEIEILSASIALIEEQHFHSALLTELKSRMEITNNKASQKIRQLKKILDRLDLRYNIVLSAPLNLLLLWNLQQMLDLEKWQKENASQVASWFDIVATFEALNSFANLSFNNPDWVFPSLNEEYFSIHAKELGHPLIAADKRVNNLADIVQKGTVIVVTGSNMAGKSTYLRSIGINAILCMAGAPVCAGSFSMTPVQLLSSMRIADNLAESTSTFYAELKKLKTIIEKINSGDRVLILLDEILRGTNTLDRHTGSEALIRQLIKKNSTAVIATHDLKLGDLAQEFPDSVKNFHFDVQVENEELYFDYKLKEGICTNMNASLLMKKIGLEV